LSALPILLNDHLLDQRLAAWGHRLVHRHRLRYKPGVSIVMSLELGDGPAWILAVSAASISKFDKLIKHAPANTILGIDPHHRVILARPEAERDLPGVRRVEKTMRKLFPELAGFSLKTLSHNPQRRYVADLTPADGSDRLLLRMYRVGLAAGHARTLKTVNRLVRDHGSGQVIVPRLRGVDQPSETMAVDFLPGLPYDQLVRDGQLTSDTIRAVARGLAAVHNLPLTDVTGLAEAPDTLIKQAELTARQVAGLLPEQADRLDRMIARLRALITDDHRSPLVACHGDFSLDQAVATPDGPVGILDWDWARIGPAADDLASVMAAGLPEAVVKDFLQAYAEHRPLPFDLPGRQAAAHLCRAADPFRRCHLDWAGDIDRCLSKAEASLDWAEQGFIAGLVG
jgi:aminoglycoside phosphotransferase (APT) family kinase protein